MGKMTQEELIGQEIAATERKAAIQRAALATELLVPELKRPEIEALKAQQVELEASTQRKLIELDTQRMEQARRNAVEILDAQTKNTVAGYEYQKRVVEAAGRLNEDTNLQMLEQTEKISEQEFMAKREGLLKDIDLDSTSLEEKRKYYLQLADLDAARRLEMLDNAAKVAEEEKRHAEEVQKAWSGRRDQQDFRCAAEPHEQFGGRVPQGAGRHP
jgi:hypothetical protein